VRAWLAAALIALILTPALAGVAGYLAARSWNQDRSSQARLLTSAAGRQLRTPAGRAAVRGAPHPAARQALLRLHLYLQVYRHGKLTYSTPGFPAALYKKDPVDGTLVRLPADDAVVALFTQPSRIDPWIATVIASCAGALLAASAAAIVLKRVIVGPLRRIRGAIRGIGAQPPAGAAPSSLAAEIADIGAALDEAAAGLRRASQERDRLDYERRLFIGAVVHDLRTPLFVLRGRIDALRRGIPDTPEKATDYIQEAASSAAALDRLVTDLFTFATLDRLGDPPPRLAALTPADLLAGTVEALRPLADDKQILLSLTGPHPDGVTLHADRHLLSRALQNLLDNAIRHTPPGGHVHLNCHGTASQITITIEDSGPGIADDDLPHIFKPLYRAEPSRNRSTGGAGLGLAIAERIAVIHGGQLTASNKPGGTGARFLLTLPADGPACTLPSMAAQYVASACKRAARTAPPGC
jgi:signal transduction histidine kinase